MRRTTYEQFDMVALLTTRNVNWMIDLPGHTPDPKGVWSVVCAFPSTGTLLVQKGNALAKVPASDVTKLANYDLKKVFKALEGSDEQE